MKTTLVRTTCFAPFASIMLIAALASMSPLTAQSQHSSLGAIDFPNSGAESAQEPFIQGVLLLHSFEFDDAARAFQAAQASDPDFALAYWGEAMTYNHPLWRQQDRQAALEALDRYEATGSTPETERERRWLGTLDALYGGDGDKTARDLAYMEAMERLQEDYPDDHEVRTFHALSILGSTNGVRDFATYMRAAATAQPVFDANPDHPGAAHYLIHSFDDPVHAPLGLPAARAYSDIAPDAAHAQHMTSHIFVAMGMWDDVVTANIRARDVQNARMVELGEDPVVCGHYTSWLHYGWLMQGRPGDATEGMEACAQHVRGGEASAGEASYFTNMRARHVLDLEDWAAADRWTTDFSDAPARQWDQDFVTAFAALKTGETERGRLVVERMRGSLTDEEEAEPRALVDLMELDALLELDARRGEEALVLLEEAASLEATLPFEFGPPASLKPPYELLGEVLLEMGRPEAAVDAFRAALKTTPRRTLSLMGLSVAAAQAGMDTVAMDADEELTAIWAAAEPSFKDRVGLGSP